MLSIKRLILRKELLQPNEEKEILREWLKKLKIQSMNLNNI